MCTWSTTEDGEGMSYSTEVVVIGEYATIFRHGEAYGRCKCLEFEYYSIESLLVGSFLCIPPS